MGNAENTQHAALVEAMRSVIDPELRRDIVELEMLKSAQLVDGVAHVVVDLTTPGCPLKQKIQADVTAAAMTVEGVTSVTVEFGYMNEGQRAALTTKLRGGRPEKKAGVSLPKGCRVVAVASGKGGVGKSTVTANLALAMQRRGHEVGVLDADVYGYSIPQILGIRQKPITVDNMIVPPVAHDVRLMSIGFFLDDASPIMWRGPMLHRALEQFLSDVHWGDIGWLFIDMPPGTGDVALSLAQLLPSSEVVVVTTPQIAAQTVAERAGLMAKKMEQTVLGVVENMADGPDGMFGSGGGEILATALGTPLLATIDLARDIREHGDEGTPVVASGAPSAAAFDVLAAALESTKGPAPAPVDRIKTPLAMV